MVKTVVARFFVLCTTGGDVVLVDGVFGRQQGTCVSCVRFVDIYMRTLVLCWTCAPVTHAQTLQVVFFRPPAFFWGKKLNSFTSVPIHGLICSKVSRGCNSYNEHPPGARALLLCMCCL